MRQPQGLFGEVSMHQVKRPDPQAEEKQRFRQLKDPDQKQTAIPPVLASQQQIRILRRAELP